MVESKIITSLGILATRTDKRGEVWSKELNIVSWNGKEPKVDIREWNEDHTRANKGITLTLKEAERVADLLMALKEERGRK